MFAPYPTAIVKGSLCSVESVRLGEVARSKRSQASGQGQINSLFVARGECVGAILMHLMHAELTKGRKGHLRV